MKVLRKLFKTILILFAASVVYNFICLIFFPPITITQVSSVFEYGLKRNYVSWNKISPQVKLAAIASEDQLFLFHNGFDWQSLEKSMSGTASKKKRKRGSAASTISQQTAKNVFLWQGSGIFKYIRKAPEFFYTFLIELTWSKKRIMEVYLNVIEMGPGVFGIDAAAHYYFNKPASKLNRNEAAQIIACLPNPKKYKANPPSRGVLWKANWIKRQMSSMEGDEKVRNFMRQ